MAVGVVMVRTIANTPPKRVVTFDGSGNKTVTANFDFIEYNLNITLDEPFPGGGTDSDKEPGQTNLSLW